jgi:hypothetical protein
MAMLTGCVTRPVNPPLGQRDASTGYYFHQQARPDNSDETLFLVAFSGGGTRAAALAYGLENKKNAKIAVFDLGGGTFDVSIMDIGEGVFEVLSTNGDGHLGGDDFDQKIIDFLAEEFRKKEGIDVRKDPRGILPPGFIARPQPADIGALDPTPSPPTGWPGV